MAKKGEGAGLPKSRSFWSVQKIFMLFLLIFGFILGIYVSHQFIEPSFNKQLTSSFAACEAKKLIQDKEIDSLLSCFQKHDLNLGEC